MSKNNIEKYLIRMLQSELTESKQRLAEPPSRSFGISAATIIRRAVPLAVRLRLMEFYWTVTRAIGLAHLHDGSQSSQFAGPKYIGALLSQQRPRVLIDATATYQNNHKNGIQRVVRSLARFSTESGLGLPVTIEGGCLTPLFAQEGSPDIVEIEEGDRLLLADSTDARILLPIMEEVSRKNGKSIVVVYDIIPLLFPCACELNHVQVFRTWFETMMKNADLALTISESVAHDVRHYLKNNGISTKSNFAVGWCHLGADLDEIVGAPNERIMKLTSAGTFFLTVGTLEPRKGHAIAIDAWEKLWSKGCSARYVIVGKRGWNVDALCRRIVEHPEFGRRLIWIDWANDADLQRLYQQAEALLFPSITEGFGLPLIEAGGFGLPVIASDIPVFREICGDGTTYFDVANADALAERLRAAIGGNLPPPTYPILTWKEATAQILSLAREEEKFKERWRPLQGMATHAECEVNKQDQNWGCPSPEHPKVA